MKVYAVLRGVKPGIYKKWDDAKKQVMGYKGAVYKSFESMEEAEKWMAAGSGLNEKTNKVPVYPIENTFVVFTDGSHRDNGGGYGIVVIDPDFGVHGFMGRCWKPGATNNYAELTAILGALKLVEGNMIIWSDSLYSIDSVTLPLKFNAPNWQIIKDVKRKLAERRSAGWNIELNHIDAHVGIEFNEEADRLARTGAIFKDDGRRRT